MKDNRTVSFTEVKHGTAEDYALLEELEKLFAEEFTVIEHWQPEEAYPGREKRELMMILQVSMISPPTGA